MFMGSPYYAINIFIMHAFTFNEVTQLFRVKRKDSQFSVQMEWAIFFTFMFTLLPKYVLTKPVLAASGMPASDYPFLHAILF
jgi:hypothetical protein